MNIYCKDPDFEQDTVLQDWLKNRFGEDTVHVGYTHKEACKVDPNDLVRKQYYLSDGRLLRCDWVSPQHRGETGYWIVSVQFYRQPKESRVQLFDQLAKECEYIDEKLWQQLKMSEIVSTIERWAGRVNCYDLRLCEETKYVCGYIDVDLPMNGLEATACFYIYPNGKHKVEINVWQGPTIEFKTYDSSIEKTLETVEKGLQRIIEQLSQILSKLEVPASQLRQD